MPLQTKFLALTQPLNAPSPARLDCACAAEDGGWSDLPQAKPRARRTLAPGFMSQRFHSPHGERLSGHCGSARLGFRAGAISRHGMLPYADASLHGIGDLD
jgi:hypothetical protein